MVRIKKEPCPAQQNEDGEPKTKTHRHTHTKEKKMQKKKHNAPLYHNDPTHPFVVPLPHNSDVAKEGAAASFFAGAAIE